MKSLRLGIVGLSEGNGHPYSWSAIFNGYNHVAMRDCPFPVIPEYMSKQNFPEDAISDARVTHIWTQDKCLSEHIARSCYIENVVDRYEHLIGKVDGILLARDDAELHLEMSKPFLEKGLPVYIDKPLANRVDLAEEIFSLEKYEGQIFTCSALRYAKEFQLGTADLEQIGNIRFIDACVMKNWEKYGIHIVEPVVNLIGNQDKLSEVKNIISQGTKIVFTQWESGLLAIFSVHGSTPCPITIRLFGDKGFKELVFKDTFFAFKQALKVFVDCVRTRHNPIKREFVLKVVKILDWGNRE